MLILGLPRLLATGKLHIVIDYSMAGAEIFELDKAPAKHVSGNLDLAHNGSRRQVDQDTNPLLGNAKAHVTLRTYSSKARSHILERNSMTGRAGNGVPESSTGPKYHGDLGWR